MGDYLNQINLSKESSYYFEANFLKIGDLKLKDFRLLSFKEMAKENTALAPGAVISRFGYIVVGVNLEGNAVCIDTKKPPNEVYLAEHNIFNGVNFVDELNNEVPFTRDVVQQKLILINKSFDEYLNNILSQYDV
jgi:hypothetical protein